MNEIIKITESAEEYLAKLIQKKNFEGYKLKYNVNGTFYYMGKDSILPDKCIQKIYPYTLFIDSNYSVSDLKPIVIYNNQLFIQDN